MAGGGSKPGERRGGRKPGTKNKKTLEITAAAQLLQADAAKGGLMPAEMLLNLSRLAYEKAVVKGDDGEPQIVEKWAIAAGDWAGKAAPYFHGRLQVTENKNVDVGEAARTVQDVEDAKRELEKNRAAPAPGAARRRASVRAPTSAMAPGPSAHANGAVPSRAN